MPKEHSITVTITTESFGEVNQRTLNTEYATTPEEFMAKDFAITEAVIGAMLAAKHKLADDYRKSLKDGK